MKKGLWISALVVVALVAVFGYLSTQKDNTSTNSASQSSQSADTSPSTSNTEPAKLTGSSLGEKLGLKGALATNYYAFDTENFDKVKDGQVPYYLNFYANWCPTCAAQAKIDLPLFNEMPDNPVVALRVNTLDSDTDADEKQLATELGVRFQHTLIFFNADGQETGRLFGTSSSEQIQAELDKAAGI